MSETSKRNEFEVFGKILEVGATKSFGASGFQKREVIVEAGDPDRSNPICLIFKGAKCADADTLGVGDAIETSGFIDGRRWDGPNGTRYFTDLTVTHLFVREKAKKPETATDWKSLLALGAAYGENESAVTERAKAHGKPFREMQEADWKKLAADIVAAHKPSGGNGQDAADDDVPF